MAIKRQTANVGYGLTNALQNLAPQPLIVKRDPTTADLAEMGTTWVNPLTDGVWVLTSITAGVATWSTSPASGVGIFSDVTITGGAGTVLTVDAGGSVEITAGDLDLLNGNLTVAGDLAVTGDVTVTGDFDITDTASIGLTSTNNAAGAITLTANGGTSETIVVNSVQGTGAGAVSLTATAGGVTMTGALNAANAINIDASAAAGGIAITSGTGGFDVLTTGGFSIDGAAASNITTTGASTDLTLSSVGGSVNITSTENAANAIFIEADGGTSETIQIHADQGTGAASIYLLSDVGGVKLESTAFANASALTLESTLGGIDMNAALAVTLDTAAGFSLDAATASNVTVTGAGQNLTLASVGGSVAVTSTEDAASAISLITNAGTSETLVLTNTQGTGASAIDLTATAGGIYLDGALNIDLDSTAEIDIDAGTTITIDAGTNVSIDAATASNFTVTGAGENLTLASVGGSVAITSTEDAASAISLTSNAGTTETIVVTNTQGTATNAIHLNATAGGVTLQSPAAKGVIVSNGTQAPGIFVGTGSPSGSLTAPQGSFYMNVAGSSTSTRAYINTDGSTAWTAITTAS